MLQHLSVVFSIQRGQGQTWTLAKDLFNDLNAVDCNFDDVITSVLDSLLAWLTRSTTIFIVEERSNI